MVDERQRKGLPIIDLTESNPTRCGFTVDAQAVLAALANSRSLTYEPDPRGLLCARQAVTGYYAERGIRVDPEQIFLTASTSEAYSYAFRLLANPGDNILAPRPSYPLLDFLTRLNDLELVSYPLAYDHRWQIDLTALAACLNQRSKAVLVVHPNNPTGSFVRCEELKFLISCCQTQPLAIIADEVFADYAFEDVAPGFSPAQGGPPHLALPRLRDRHPLPQGGEGIVQSGTGQYTSATPKSRDTNADRVRSLAAESGALTFTLSGLSKISALPQMKLAWVIVNGPEDLLRAALARLEVIADTYLSVSAPLAGATPELLELRHQVQPQILGRVRQNLYWLDEQLSRGVAISRLQTEGGWYVILRMPAVRSDEDWAMEWLREEGVLVHPGHFYDFSCESHLVVSLLPFTEVFREGMLKILARTAKL
jgi:aspartate/methionine/tyrosine aminotransferase